MKKQSITELKLEKRRIKVIYISSYIPRECGIATFTKDLTTAINILNPDNLAEIMAMDEKGSESRVYPWEVKFRVKDYEPECLEHAIHYINQSGCDVVNLQHEYGIYGQEDGKGVIDFLKKIQKPIVVTLHTVLDNPSQRQKEIISKMSNYVEAFIVMINEGKRRLEEIYKISEEKIVVIPHGVPDIPYGPTNSFKKLLKLHPKRPIISTFGLINEGKGLEYGIEAMKEVVKKFPKAKYLIIGQTHPIILKKEGEKYRENLKHLVKKLRLQRNVIFVNKYLSLEELILYLRATDIYLTAYLNPQQISSGTLAYAVGAGKSCISTKYAYANEVLGEDRGALVDFKDSSQIAQSIISFLEDEEKINAVGLNAYLYGRKMTWPNVALSYLDLFGIVSKK